MESVGKYEIIARQKPKTIQTNEDKEASTQRMENYFIVKENVFAFLHHLLVNEKVTCDFPKTGVRSEKLLLWAKSIPIIVIHDSEQIDQDKPVTKVLDDLRARISSCEFTCYYVVNDGYQIIFEKDDKKTCYAFCLMNSTVIDETYDIFRDIMTECNQYLCSHVNQHDQKTTLRDFQCIMRSLIWMLSQKQAVPPTSLLASSMDDVSISTLRYNMTFGRITGDNKLFDHLYAQVYKSGAGWLPLDHGRCKYVLYDGTFRIGRISVKVFPLRTGGNTTTVIDCGNVMAIL